MCVLFQTLMNAVLVLTTVTLTRDSAAILLALLHAPVLLDSNYIQMAISVMVSEIVYQVRPSIASQKFRGWGSEILYTILVLCDRWYIYIAISSQFFSIP